MPSTPMLAMLLFLSRLQAAAPAASSVVITPIAPAQPTSAQPATPVPAATPVPPGTPAPPPPQPAAAVPAAPAAPPAAAAPAATNPPAATQAAPQPASRLRITNGCREEALWVAHMAAAGVGPDPQNVKLAPLQSYDFATFAGLSGTRYWPKLRCDEQGNRCEIGESGGPEEVCHRTAGCAPPVDTKFEASFGAEEDWVDISLVDGFTLPFRFEMQGNCTAGFGDKVIDTSAIDCSQLSFEQCPKAEDMGESGSNVNLQVLHPDTRQAVGCYSPCSKLTLSQWGNADATAAPPSDSRIAPYCCPTPPESPDDCRAGPVPNTSFVRAVHSMCPGVYGYSYDDGMGLLKCSSATRYEVTFFCPASSPLPVVPALPTAPAAAFTARGTATPGVSANGAASQQPTFLTFVRKFEADRGSGWEMGQALAPAALSVCTAAALAAVSGLLAAAALRRSWRGSAAGPHRPALYEQLDGLEGATPGFDPATSAVEAIA